MLSSWSSCCLAWCTSLVLYSSGPGRKRPSSEGKWFIGVFFFKFSVSRFVSVYEYCLKVLSSITKYPQSVETNPPGIFCRVGRYHIRGHSEDAARLGIPPPEQPPDCQGKKKRPASPPQRTSILCPCWEMPWSWGVEGSHRGDRSGGQSVTKVQLIDGSLFSYNQLKAYLKFMYCTCMLTNYVCVYDKFSLT